MARRSTCPICSYTSLKNGGIYRHIVSSDDTPHSAYARTLKTCSKCNRTFNTVQGRGTHQGICDDDNVHLRPPVLIDGFANHGRRSLGNFNEANRSFEETAAGVHGVAKNNATRLRTRNASPSQGDDNDQRQLRGGISNPLYVGLDANNQRGVEYASLIPNVVRETNLLMTEHGPLSPESRHRMLLEQFYFLGCPEIPATVLHYFQSPKRQRWGSSGEKEDRPSYATPSYLDRDLARAINSLTVTKHVHLRGEHPNKMFVFRLDKPTGFALEENTYQLGALQLAICWFPYRHESLYGHNGRLLLPLVQAVTGYIRPLMHKGQLSAALKADAAEMLLSASRFSDPTWKQQSIGLAAELVSEPKDSYSLYLARWARERQLCFSDEPLDAASLFQPDNPRSNAQLGELFLRQATVFMDQRMWGQALKVLNNFMPFSDQPSTQEKPVIQKKEFLIARIHHLKGEFIEAKKAYVKLVCDMKRWETGDACLLTSRLADIDIELGNFDDAVARCTADLDLWDTQGWGDRPKAYCIRISLADAWLQQDMFLEAEKIYHSLKVSLGQGQVKLPRNAKINYIRILFSLARAAHSQCHWKLAYSRWTEMKAYDNWEGDFVELAICSSLSVVCNNLKCHEEAQQNATRAKVLLTSVVVQFWIPLLHRWVEDMLHIIQARRN